MELSERCQCQCGILRETNWKEKCCHQTLFWKFTLASRKLISNWQNRRASIKIAYRHVITAANRTILWVKFSSPLIQNPEDIQTTEDTFERSNQIQPIIILPTARHTLTFIFTVLLYFVQLPIASEFIIETTEKKQSFNQSITTYFISHSLLNTVQ